MKNPFHSFWETLLSKLGLPEDQQKALILDIEQTVLSNFLAASFESLTKEQKEKLHEILEKDNNQTEISNWIEENLQKNADSQKKLSEAVNLSLDEIFRVILSNVSSAKKDELVAWAKSL